VDSKANDLFAFGLILLEIGLRKNIQQIYDKHNGFRNPLLA